MNPLRVCVAGTWDPDFHRNRALLRFLERAGVRVVTCHARLWGERGGDIVGKAILPVLLRAVVAYPLLMWRFLRAPRPDVVLVPYPGHFDAPLLAFLCRIRGVPLVLDLFISLHDTVVSDRGLASEDGVLARVLAAVDRAACRRAHRVLADTPVHADFFARATGVDRSRFHVLWVGAEEDVFHPRPEVEPEPGRVLFYGTFIPLHGVKTIVRAAKALEGEDVRFRIIGDGQEGPGVERLLSDLEVANVERVRWVPLEALGEEIARSDICLGIFGTTGKADRVVPNKVFQCMAVGRPVVTGDTEAVRSAFRPDEVALVPVGDPESLARRIRALRADPEGRESMARAGRQRFEKDYAEDVLARRLAELLEASRASYQSARIPSP